MIRSIKENFIKFVTSRLFVLIVLTLAAGGLLIYRVFLLQIVEGQEYLDNFQLKIRKERSLASTRGRILDCNGNVLAYNELAYSVTIEDVYESGSTKNAQLNETIYQTIRHIEANGDHIQTDFHIVMDENGEYVFNVSDNVLLRFLADVYGYRTVSDLKYAEKTATPEEVVEYMAGRKYYAVSSEYDRDSRLKIIAVRFMMSANSYQKYIATTIATNVSEETVAVIMENAMDLPGVHITEDTIRKYVDSLYFSAILGYTGKIDSEELAYLQESDPSYTPNDRVGKTGIEQAMELELQGKKGSETVYVDNLGRVIESTNVIEPEAGKDIYLTIDKDLQIATYHILEQRIAGILVSKIENIKEYIPGEHATQSKIRIPIYDVYVALFQNNIIKWKTLSSPDSGETTQLVYRNFLSRQEAVIATLRDEMLHGNTAYSKLSKEMKTYESFIVNYLTDTLSIIDKSVIDKNDPIYQAWKTEETIGIREYLQYAISMNWIDVNLLELDMQYADSTEIYEVLVDDILARLINNLDFSKRIIKHMIMDNRITGKQICMILCEESIVNVPDAEYDSVSQGQKSPYRFLLDRIGNLDITPAQLALDPCSGSIVITDVNNGNVLALVTYPGYDNNLMANSIDAEYYSQLLNDASRPLWNYATQQTSAPGSTFKMVTAAAALEEGVIRPRDTVTCRGTYDVLSPTIYKCWISPGAHGPINVTTAIAKSCNYFFYEMGYRLSTVGTAYNSELGLNTLQKYADILGLSERSGVEIAESEPNVSNMYSVVSAIGQGTNDYTTVGLARYVTTIANSGTCYNLTLLDRETDSDGNLIREFEAGVRNVVTFQESTWNVLHNGMKQVVEGKSYFKDFDVTVAGKTGTAQESTARPTHALFVCYAPFEKPQIAVATRIAFGYSSDYAAETTKSVLMYYFNLQDEEDIVNGHATNMESAGVTMD